MTNKFRRNPYILVFGLRKYKRPPRIMPSDRAAIARDLRRHKGARLRHKGIHLQWIDAQGRHTKFTPKRSLLAVVSYVPLKKRLSRKEREAERQRLERRRKSDARRRTDLKIVDHMAALRRLRTVIVRYPSRIDKFYKPRYAEDLSPATAILRARALDLGKRAALNLDAMLALDAEVRSMVEEEAAADAVWYPVHSYLRGLVKREPYNLPAKAWDYEFASAAKKSRPLKRLKGEEKADYSAWVAVDPVSVIRVFRDNPDLHPEKSANLLMFTDELSYRGLSLWSAPTYTMFAICRMRPEMDECISDGMLVKYPEDMRKASPFKLVRAEPGRKYVVLSCPLIYNDYTRDDLSFIEAHDWMFEVIEKQSTEPSIHEVRARFQRLGRIKADIESGLRGGKKDRLWMKSIQLLPKELVGANDEKLKLMARVQLVLQKEDDNAASWWRGQEVWKAVFQRHFWAHREMFVYPAYFLGYTSRGGSILEDIEHRSDEHAVATPRGNE